MKNIILIIFVFSYSFGLFAQVPQAINYQAVARDGSGNILPNTLISLRFSINNGIMLFLMIVRENYEDQQLLVKRATNADTTILC